MSLGLTQPLRPTDPAFPWEFTVRTKDCAEWPADLLYQLLTQWLCERGEMGLGYHLPLVFFTDPSGKLWAGLTNDLQSLNVVGSMRGLFLWNDEEGVRFRVQGSEFGLLNVIAVTGDEEELARSTTPAHLVLFLRQMGVYSVCDPNRQSVLTLPEASERWLATEQMSHDEVLLELGSK